MQSPIHKRYGARLPHWTAEGATYAVTFRLHDAIPSAAAQKLAMELEDLEKRMSRGAGLTLSEQVRLSRLRSEKVDALLNAGHGECLMAEPAVAEIVANSLKFFDRKRYTLLAWCVMPNHVHVVFTPIGDHELSDILHSWKSFTAKAINKHLGRTGGIWQREYYDHLIRDKADLMHNIHYVRENPDKAGLKGWKWVA